MLYIFVRYHSQAEIQSEHCSKCIPRKVLTKCKLSPQSLTESLQSNTNK